MAYKKKTWVEKLYDSKDLPKVEKIKKAQEKKWGKGTMAIPSPLEVDEIIRTVPRGKVITVNQIRNRVASKHSATIGCPITSGIFAWIVAFAAEEMRMNGKKKITPWWRVLKGKGFLNEKFPGGAENHRALLEKEGHHIITRGKSLFVADVLETAVIR